MGRNLSGVNAQAAKEFCLQVKQRLMDNVLDVRVFGSVARGMATPESDIDVLVLLKYKQPEVRDIIAEIALDVNLKYDVLISPVIMSKEHYSKVLFQETNFFRNLEQEGVSL